MDYYPTCRSHVFQNLHPALHYCTGELFDKEMNFTKI